MLRTVVFVREWYRAVQVQSPRKGLYFVVESQNYAGQWSPCEPGREWYSLADCREYTATWFGSDE